ncbi:MAG: 4-hydroxybutyrate--acetyl-CoA CoA transferase [Defluviitaleaceae bacterium]|nr:4-hydroxybutyrate--acetyl-CoA CoA transferase [Defluviitaleaceae bacterium]
MKTITACEALEHIKSDMVVVSAMAAAEPKEMLKNLHKIAHKVKNVTITNCLPIEVGEYLTNPDYKDSFNIEGWFYSAAMRKAHKNGNISFIPNHLHLAGIKRLHHKKPHIFIGTATPPNKHGYMSLSLSNVYEKRMIEHAETVILEINPNYPRTFGDLEIHVDDVDYAIETGHPVPELPDTQPTEKDLKIGGYIAKMINDGDCIQLGIGGIPNAVAASLLTKKGLGIHTEMFTTGLMKLVKAGAATGKHKQINKSKHVAAFALGTRELYDFIDDNPSVLIMDGNWTNDPNTIAQNHNQVSINTTLEIDLTGQCASESIGSKQYSGTGGQTDTATGAQRSKNGRSFIALYSTATVKNQQNEQNEISKITPFLKRGAIVSLSRNDVDMVVTEYGVAELRGTSLKERATELISIAHPKFKDSLYQQAKEEGIIV